MKVPLNLVKWKVKVSSLQQGETCMKVSLKMASNMEKEKLFTKMAKAPMMEIGSIIK